MRIFFNSIDSLLLLMLDIFGLRFFCPLKQTLKSLCAASLGVCCLLFPLQPFVDGSCFPTDLQGQTYLCMNE